MPLRLETERLILTPENEQDAEWLTELLNARGAQTFTVEHAREQISAMASSTAANGIGALALRTRTDDDALGNCAIIVGRGSLDEPEIAYELLPRAHGHGYATEASRAARRSLRHRPHSHLVDCSVVERTFAVGAPQARLPTRPQHD